MSVTNFAPRFIGASFQLRCVCHHTAYTDMVKLADTQDLGSCAVRCAGSSPVIRTKPFMCEERLSSFLRSENYHLFWAAFPNFVASLNLLR